MAFLTGVAVGLFLGVVGTWWYNAEKLADLGTWRR